MKKLSKARTVLVMNHPFWASLALRLPLVEDKGCSTGYTDGTKIAYNPKFIQNLTEPGVVSFIAHEVCHPSLLHHLREGGRDHQRWNWACDYAVNEILKDSGFEIPDDWMLDEKYHGMSAEAIYDQLPEKPPRGWGGNFGPGEVRKYPGKGGGGPTQAEIREQEAAWKTAIAQAAQVAKAKGELSGGLERWVQEILIPRVNWRAVLASYLTDTVEGDYSWREPNRRYATSGVYLPSIASEPTGSILLLIDTSGSVGEDDMQELAAEAQGVMAAYDGLELDVVYVDSQVQGHQHFTPADIPLKLEPKGGGGTDYRPGFAWAKEKGLTPSCAIYLTDGWCGDFPDSPPYPVLWVLGGGSPARKFSPPFGEALKMSRP